LTAFERVPADETPPEPSPATLVDPPPTGLGSTLGPIARGMRPRQWIKNLLVFMAPAAAGVLGDWHTTLRVIGAFLVFCVVASGTYLVNDVIDRVPGLATRAAYAKQALRDKLIDHKEYIRRTGDDMPEIKDWVWGKGTLARGATSTSADNV